MSVHFQGVKAVVGVDLAMERGEILGLIGPNGAGKTTLLNALSGFQPLTSGGIWLGGRPVTGWVPFRLAQAGLSRTFQNVRLFGGLTVLENIELGAVGTGLSRKAAQVRAWDLLDRMNLADKAAARADALPYGQERRVGILRAVASYPRFLLLDEPAAGLNEAESDDLMKTIADLRSEIGCGVLVIEHDMRLIMGLCDRIQVLDYGKTICIGNPTEVQSDPTVITAYLGTTRPRIVANS